MQCLNCHRVLGDIHSQECKYDTDSPRLVDEHHCTQKRTFPNYWNAHLNKDDVEYFCENNGLIPQWNIPVKVGDFYIAKRNTGFKLLECKKVGEGCVHPTENEYSFDFCECIKVVLK